MKLTINGVVRKPSTYDGIAKVLRESKGATAVLDLEGAEFEFSLLDKALGTIRQLIATPVGNGTFTLEVRE